MSTLQSVADLQQKAIAKADALSVQMQQFIQILLADSLIGSGKVPIDTNFDVTAIQSALNGLLAKAQLNPPVPLEPASLPSISIPKVAKGDDPITAPSFIDVSLPKLADPVAPKLAGNTFKGVRASLLPLVRPARPTITLPAVPVFTNIVMPTITDIVMPTLSAVVPVDDLIAPSNLFTFSERAYQSALLDSSKAKLLNDLNNGGYGIEVADENALWGRARDRELRNSATATADVARAMAARGFALPPGAMLAQLSAIQQDAAEKTSTVSREIALKRADMYVENRKFTITEVREIEQLSINLYMSVMERSLNAAKATAEFGIAIFNARVSKFNTLMEAYKTKVMAYAEQVRAAVSQLEAQKVKLEVTRTEVDLQKTQAQLYQIKVEGQKAILELYRTDISALQGLADVERLKLDAFKADVEVFSEQIRANSLQLQGYEAEVRGDLAKVEIYKSQVGAQLSKAEFAKAQASIVESNARVKIENLRGAIAAAEATADVYRAQTAGIASSNEAQGRAFAARTEAFRTISNVYGDIGKLELGGAEINLKAKIAEVTNETESAKLVINSRVTAAATAADALGKQIQAQLSQVLAIASDLTQN